MASLTLQNIRDYVRSYLDVDEQDMPNALLDVWVREGTARIERAEKRWPFFEEQWTLTTVAGTGTYTIDTSVGSDVDQIAAIRGPSWELRWIGRDEAEARYPLDVDDTGQPRYWSQWAGTLTLYPTPDSAESLTVRGYRVASDWVTQGAGGSPDYPEELHQALASFVLARAYFQQEDEVLGAQHGAIFEAELELFRRRLLDAPPHQPLVLNGTRSRRGREGSGRLRYPWEY